MLSQCYHDGALSLCILETVCFAHSSFNLSLPLWEEQITPNTQSHSVIDVQHWCWVFFCVNLMNWCKPNYFRIWEIPVTCCVFLHKNRSWSSRIPAQTNESVELLGKEHSSDQCHMMQEVCQHFSSSSLAIGRGMYTLPARKGWIMETSHELGDTLQLLFCFWEWISQFISPTPSTHSILWGDDDNSD